MTRLAIKTVRKTRQSRSRPRFGFEPVTSRKIRAVVDKIVQDFNPGKVILFGSYAYGKPTVDSDVDVLVVMESNERPAARASRIIGAVTGKTFPMDIIVRTPKELEQRLDVGDFFFKEIVERGKVLYERRAFDKSRKDVVASAPSRGARCVKG
jgi:predicted nucleotidyltransferase